MSKQQRRKDNARSASSAQAANLLGATEFIGFDIGVTNVFEAVDTELCGLDNEASIILKKLSKKDPQTREKALRELVDYVNEKNSIEVEATFSYFSTAFPRISLDGSITVRQLAIRNVSLFIGKLKKSAEKQLKKLVPYILISTCDMSSIVSSQAEDLMKNCFPDGKSEKVVQIFAEETANVCLEMISQSHYLFQAQRYDEEETSAQRESRLIAESLYLLAKLAEKSNQASDIARRVFENNGQIKKFLANGPSMIQTGLLNLVQKLPPTFNLPESQISKFAVDNLDNAEVSVGTACFNLFHLLISQHKDQFFKKFDAKKDLSPRLLNIVRKKNNHWKYCGPFLLPTFASIFEQLPSEEATLFGLNFLVSFTDNLPFIAAAPLSSWSSSFAECFKFLLSRISGSNSTEQLIPIVLNTINKADLTGQEVQNDFVGLISWLCEKKLLPPFQLGSLINNLELNLMNKRPETDQIITKLFKLGLEELITFHSDSLRKEDIPISFITSLANVPTGYLEKVADSVNLLDLLSKEQRSLSSAELEQLAVLVLRILKRSDSKVANFQEDLNLAILAKRNSAEIELTELLKKLNLEATNPNIFISLMKNCNNPKECDLFIEILKTFEEEDRMEVMKTLLEKGSHNDVNFVIRSLDSIYWNSVAMENISTWFWLQYFNPKNKDFSLLLAVLKTHPPSQETVEELFPSCFSFMQTDSPGAEVIYPSMERLIPLVQEIPDLAKGLLVTEGYFFFLLEDADLKFVARELSFTSPFMLTCRLKDKDSLLDVPDSDAIAFIERLIPSVPLYIYLLNALKGKEINIRYTLATILIVETYLEMIKESPHLEFTKPLEECSKDIRATCFVENYGVDRRDGIVKEPLPFKDAFLLLATRDCLKHAITYRTLQHLSTRHKEFCVDIANEAEQLPIQFGWTIRTKTTRKLDVVERFLSRYYCEDSPMEFISHLQEYCAQDDSTWQEDVRLFNVSAALPLVWELNIAILQAATIVMKESFDKLKSEVLDWILCGQVAAFESVDVLCANEELQTVRAEAFLGNLLLFYRQCNATRQAVGDVVFSDWKDFYYPFISRIVVRLWASLKLKADSPYILPTRELCRIMYDFEELPTDIGLPGDLSTRLMENEQMILMVDRCLQGVKSGNFMDEAASLHTFLLIAVELYRSQNGDFEVEEKVSQSGPKKLQIARSLLKVINDKEVRGFARFACFQAALEPLRSDRLVDEEKILYCDSFPPLVNTVLPELIEYLKNTDSRELEPKVSQLVMGNQWNYLLGIVHEMCSTIPAVIRTWYNGLPKNAAQIVQKFMLEHVCGTIILDEIQRVLEDSRKSSLKSKEFKIKVTPLARQIAAEYLVEETRMVLTITLPENYPLSVPEIEMQKAIVPSARVKKWLLQMTSYLFYQNGSIINGIQKWKQNVDNDVEGAEACTICMTTIHFDSHQLPKVSCRQCKNKFHSTCLYKWFETSHNTQCPLCRNNFT